MEILQRQDDFDGVESGGVLVEPTTLAEVLQESAPFDVVHDQVKLFLSLEGKMQLHEERMLPVFHNVFLHWAYEMGAIWSRFN